MKQDPQNHSVKKHYLNKWPFIILATVIIILALLVIYHDFRPVIDLLLHYNHANQPKLLHLIHQHSFRDMIMLIIIIGCMNAIPGVSNSVICIFAGVCYGPLMGLIINWIGNIGGNCMVAALINKINFSDRFKNSKMIKRLTQTKHPLIALTAGYMIPIVPSALVNYAVVQMGINRQRFLAMVTIGMLPTSYLYAFGGDAIMKGDLKRIITAVIAIVIIIGLYKIIDHARANKTVQ